ELGKLRALKERLDAAFALVLARIRLEGARLLGGGQDTEQIQIGAAKKAQVVHLSRGADPQPAELCENVFVDPVARLNPGPREIRTGGDKGDPDGHLLVKVPHQNGDFVRNAGANDTVG